MHWGELNVSTKFRNTPPSYGQKKPWSMFCLFMFTKCKQIIESSKWDMYAVSNTYPEPDDGCKDRKCRSNSFDNWSYIGSSSGIQIHLKKKLERLRFSRYWNNKIEKSSKIKAQAGFESTKTKQIGISITARPWHERYCFIFFERVILWSRDNASGKKPVVLKTFSFVNG